MTNKITTSGQPLEHLMFASVPIHIPNALGFPFKTELVLERSPARTIKINWWHAPDDDRMPHNHPWDFKSTVLHGQLTEVRYYKSRSTGEIEKVELTHYVGETYFCPKEDYHVVTKVVKGTVTRMECLQANEGNTWGYLNVSNNSYEEAQKDPSFMSRLQANNRFL